MKELFFKNILAKIFPVFNELHYVRENVKPIRKDQRSNIKKPETINEYSVLSFDDEEMLSIIENYKEYHELFNCLRRNQKINTKALETTYIRNGYYPTPDAETYAYMIKSYSPELIIEIGSGYSTLIARKTIDYYGLKTKIKIIDPEPRTDVSSYVDEKILGPVEDTNVKEFLKYNGNTILFIDSSHILRSGGDLPFLYNDLIPKLPENYLVHVHDIFLPYDYPDIYRSWFYNEQYLLYALLSNKERYQIKIATYYLSKKYPEIFERCLNTNAISRYQSYGGSIWFRIIK